MNSSLLCKKLWAVIGCLTLFTMIVNGASQTNDQSFLGQVQSFEKLSESERIACLEKDAGYILRLKETLLSKLGSENEDTRLYAAFFLGIYRFPEAAGPLASVISMEDKTRPNSPEYNNRLWAWGSYPAEAALMRIGSPAIPYLIHNLEESDDAKVRELSLNVLYYIDHDKDIVQLRLQKALAAQSDRHKKARLQSAQQALLDPKFGK